MYYSVWIQFLIFILSFVIVWIASDKVIDYAVQIADLFKVTKLFIGFIFIGFSTALPEIAIVISSAFNQIPEIAVGNVMGANLNNLTLALGVIAFLGRILDIKGKSKKNILILLSIIVFIMSFVFFINEISKIHGLLLLLFYFLAVLWMWKTRKIVEFSHVVEEPEGRKRNAKYRKVIILSKFILGISVILFASEFAVDYSVSVASFLGLPLEIFGATIFAFVTTVPELALSLNAIRKKEYNMAVATLLGSILPHLCLCLGVLTFLISGNVDLYQIKSLIVFIFAALFVIGFTVLRFNKITRAAGFLLICLFFLSLIYHLSVK